MKLSTIKSIKWVWLVSAIVSAISLGVETARAQPLPAVSHMTSWLGMSVGSTNIVSKDSTGTRQTDSNPLAMGEAGLAAPLGEYFGFQLNGWDGAISHNNYQSVEGIIFWRNPCKGLLGPRFTYIDTRHLYLKLYGLDGEAYFNNWTVGVAVGGVKKIDNKSSYYQNAFVSWYGSPNLKLGSSVGKMSAETIVAIDAEYMSQLTALPGLSFFADIGAGNNNFRFGLIGIRYYFGDDLKSLIDRHREDIVLPPLNLLTVNKN